MNGKRYAKGDLVPWKERGLPLKNIERMYNEHHLHHNEELEESSKPKIGDGLEEMSVSELHILVDTINDKVKEKTSTKEESTIHAKQCGLIRSWRANYGEIEAD